MKTAYLLRLTPMGRPYPAFLKTGKLSTCGFVFSIFGMVKGVQPNVVDRAILWRVP